MQTIVLLWAGPLYTLLSSDVPQRQPEHSIRYYCTSCIFIRFNVPELGGTKFVLHILRCHNFLRKEKSRKHWLLKGRQWHQRDQHISLQEVSLCGICLQTLMSRKSLLAQLFFLLVHCSLYLWCILANFSVCIVSLTASLSLKYCVLPNKI